MPGTLRARARLDREHRAPAAQRDEVLLEVLAESPSGRAAASLGHAVAAVAELGAELAQRGRRGVAQIGPVLLDRAVDRLGERRERRVDRLGDLAEEGRVLLLERGARAQRPEIVSAM